MWRIAVVCALALGAAWAQTPVQPKPETFTCAAFDPDTPRTAAQIEAARACLETLKLQKDIEAARSRNLFGIPSDLAALIGAAIGAVAAALIGQRSTFAQLYDKRAADRETHNLALYDRLAETDASRQRTAAAVLLSRMWELRRGRNRITAREEIHAIATVLLASLGNGKLDPGVAKFIADKVIEPLDGLRHLAPRRQSPLKRYVFQKLPLIDAYWKRIDAREVDYFGSTLLKTSFREADLRRAVFFGADVTGVVFEKADLRGADLRDAVCRIAHHQSTASLGDTIKGPQFKNAKLQGAKLQGADLSAARHLDTAHFDKSTQWDGDTKWPPGFTPPKRADATGT